MEVNPRSKSANKIFLSTISGRRGGWICKNILPETVIHMKIIREGTFLITGKTHMLRGK